jgi:hypothetical protein
MADEKPINLDNWLAKKISISLGKVIMILLLFPIVVFIVRNNPIPGKAESKGLEIETLIRQVKSELMKADTARITNNEKPLFKLRDFEMEISFTVRKNNNADAKFDYQFVTVEVGSETTNEKVQKLMLHWDAIQPLPDTIPPDNGQITVKENSP